MLIRRIFRLCLFEHAQVVFRIEGAMPKFSLSAAWATIYLEGSAGYLWRYDADFGASDTGELQAIDETIPYPAIDNEIDVAFELHLPDDVSTAASSLTFGVDAPTFEISPVFGGRDLRCLQTTEPPRLSIRGFDIYEVPDEQFAARLIQRLYVDVDAAKAGLVSIGINPATIFSRPPDDTEGGGVIACQEADTCFIGKIGTTTNGQLITQGWQMTLGPVPFAGVGTIPIWGAAAVSAYNVAAQLPLNEISRFVLCGHSLGGCAMSVLAAILLQRFPAAQVDVLTFGAPKPGDESLMRALRPIRSCRIENDTDPIPYTPPSPSQTSLGVKLFIGDTIIANMAKFRHPVGRYVLWPDGTRSEGDPVQPDIDIISLLVLAWVAGVPEIDPASHNMSEYVRRLDLA